MKLKNWGKNYVSINPNAEALTFFEVYIDKARP